MTGVSRATGAFLFSDIEGSTRRWERHGEAMLAAITRHDEILEAAITAHGGTVVNRTGDGLIASFGTAADALDAAADIQRRIAASGEQFADVDGLSVREAVHVGDVVLRDGEVHGWALNFGARFTAIGHGGQVLVSAPARAELGEALPVETSLRPLGRMRLRDIAQPAEVFQFVAPGLRTEFPPLRDTIRSATAPPPPSLIGRDADVGEVVRQLGLHRLVTVAGPPGIGTSSVAAVVADQVAANFAYGVRHCDLAGVAPASAHDAIATALGIGTRPGQSTGRTIVEWVGEHDVLLVLEHVGHATESIARLLRELLSTAPGSSVLCASQRPLDIGGEAVHRLGPLAVDDAVQLFRERASAAGIDLAGEVDEADARRICERLDGVPLSIEVAAANLVAFGVGELAAMLERRDLPSSMNGEGADVLGPMHEAIGLSVDALDPDAQDILGATTVFVGSFDRGEFARVCAPDLDAAAAGRALTDLVTRSLVHADRTAGEPTFRVLDSIARPLRERITPEAHAAARRRLVDAVVEFAGEAADGLRGPDELLWHRRVVRSFDNIREVFGHALATGDLPTAAHLSTVLWDFGFMRMNEEYFRWSERVLDTFAATDDPAALGPVNGAAALGAWIRADLEAVEERSARAVRLEREYGLPFDLPARLARISSSVYSSQPLPLDVFAAAAEYQRARPELYFHVNVDTTNSIMATWLGQQEDAERRALRAVRSARESENPSSLAFGLWALGAALDPVDPLHAESLLGMALDEARGVGNGWVTALVQMSLASLRRRTGGPSDAVPVLRDLLELLWRAGHRSHLWTTVRLSALVLGDLGEDELCLGLHASVAAASMSMPPTPGDARAIGEQLARIRTTQDPQWVARVEALASTWTIETVLTTTRDALAAHAL